MATKKSFLIDLQVAGASAAQAALGGVENNLKGIAKQAAAAAAAYISVSGAMQFLRHSVTQAIAAEDAQKKLTVAIGRSSKELLDYASARQRVTRFDDDGTVAAMAVIGAFTSEERVIKRLTAAAQDLAEAKGMDLNSAAELVAKSVYGEINALGRYGVAAEGARGSTERLEAVTRGIAELWGGQAAAAAETLQGKVQQAQNAFDDMAQTVGEKLAPTLKGFAELVTRMLSPEEGMDGLTQASHDYRGAITDLILEMQRLGLASRDAAAADQIRTAYQTLNVAQLELLLGQNRELDDELIKIIHSLEAYNKLQQEKNEADKESAPAIAKVVEAQRDLLNLHRFEQQAYDTMLQQEAERLRNLYEMSSFGEEENNRRNEAHEAMLIALADDEEWLANQERKVAAIERERKVARQHAIATGLEQAQMLAAYTGNAKAATVLAKIQALNNAYVAAGNTLELTSSIFPPPIPQILAGLTMAAGIAYASKVQAFADGGWVRGHGGPRSDSVPARLSAGERVLSAREIAAMGGRAGVDAAARGMRGSTVVNVTLSGPIDRQWWQDVALPQLQDAVRLSA